MRKTANYDLCQWDSEDRILREDFNSDNEKIDAAIADAGFLAKLLDVTTQEPCTQLDLDVSGIQPEQYAKLVIRTELKITSEEEAVKVVMRVNGARNPYYNGSGSVFPSYLASCYVLTEPPVGCGGEITLMEAGHQVLAISDLFSGLLDSSTHFYEQEVHSWRRTGSSGTDSLETLNFFNEDSLSLDAGSRILIYGVKK